MAGLISIIFVPVPVTLLLVTSIVSNVLSSLVFLIVILPLSTSTFSSKVKIIFAVLETSAASSAGVLEERVGAALHEDGTLCPHLGFSDAISFELEENRQGDCVFGKCETSKHDKS